MTENEREVNKRFKRLLDALCNDCRTGIVTSLRLYPTTYGVNANITTVLRKKKYVTKENGKYVWNRRTPDSQMANYIREACKEYFYDTHSASDNVSPITERPHVSVAAARVQADSIKLNDFVDALDFVRDELKIKDKNEQIEHAKKLAHWKNS